MSTQEGTPRTISEAKWDVHKSKLRDLYVKQNWTLKDIRASMREVHGFEASKQQYERQFKKWSFKKNLTRSQWNELHLRLRKRPLDIDNMEVLVDGRVLPAQKLKKEFSRKPVWLEAPDLHNELSSSTTKSHPEIVIRPLESQKSIYSSISNLPIFKYITAVLRSFHDQLEPANEYDPRPRRRSLDLAIFRTILESPTKEHKHSCVLSNIDPEKAIAQSSPSDHALREIEALVPNIESSMIDLNPNMTAIFCILCLLLNNLNNERIEKNLAQLLLMSESRILWRTLKASSSVGSKTIVHAIFKIACKTFNVPLLKKLLCRKLDLETPIPDKIYGSSTALQMTARRMQTWDDSKETREMAEMFVDELLERGADPNKSAFQGVAPETYAFPKMLTSVTNECSKGRYDCLELPLSILLEKPRTSFSTVIHNLLNRKAHVCERVNLTKLIENHIEVGVLQRLIDLGVEVNGYHLATRRYWYPLQAAVGTRRIDTARLLLDHKAHPDISTNVEPDKSFMAIHADMEKQWRSPLALALEFNLDFAEELVQQHAALSGCYLDHLDKLPKPNHNISYRLLESLDDWRCLRSEILRIENSYHWGDYTALQTAITSKSVEATKLILEAGASIDCCHGTPPLVLAAQVGHLQIVSLLLDYHANVDTISLDMDPRYWKLTPLAEAAARDDISMVSMLLENDADINCCDKEQGLTPLQAAIICGAESCIVRLLSDRNIDILHSGSIRGVDAFTAAVLANDKDHFYKLCSAMPPSKSIPPRFLEKMLSAAISVGDEYFISRLQQMGANPYAESVVANCIRSATAFRRLCQAGLDLRKNLGDYSVADMTFSCAIENGSIEVAQFILKEHAAISPTASQKLVNILVSGNRFVPRENVDCLVELVLESRKWSMQSNDSYILIAAIRAIPYRPKARKIAERIIENGIDVFTQPLHLETPLMAASDIGDSALIRSLLGRDAPPDKASGELSLGLDCLTPLQIACRRGDMTIVELLLEYGADVNRRATPRSGFPITLAVESMQDHIVRLLIRHGANVNAVASEGIYGKTALQIACQSGRLDTVRLLLSAGARVNAAASPNHGTTALQAAAAGGYLGIVQVLLEADADIQPPVSFKESRTALEAAAACGRLDTVALLLQQYRGAESIPDVCQRAARFAEEQGHVVVARFLETYGIPVEPVD